ncbi:UNVERIFIED_CONTAM: hypothetical protein PYX00_003071 [Menopon gallinae]|uniref:Uncharacterized protein n=1 Tax=Menopon gallinae TaxID=328185 RepID=A0AAW2HZC0_9NEOP
MQTEKCLLNVTVIVDRKVDVLLEGLVPKGLVEHGRVHHQTESKQSRKKYASARGRVLPRKIGSTSRRKSQQDGLWRAAVGRSAVALRDSEPFEVRQERSVSGEDTAHRYCRDLDKSQVSDAVQEATAMTPASAVRRDSRSSSEGGWVRRHKSVPEEVDCALRGIGWRKGHTEHIPVPEMSPEHDARWEQKRKSQAWLPDCPKC